MKTFRERSTLVNWRTVTVGFFVAANLGLSSTAWAVPFKPPATTGAIVEQITPNPAGLGDVITVHVRNLDDWLIAANFYRVDQKLPPKTMWDLVPFINGRALPGIRPDKIDRGEAPEPMQVVHLTYSLRVTPATKPVWNSLLNKPVFRRSVTITLGFEDMGQETVPTQVRDDTVDQEAKFELIVLRGGVWLWFGLIVLLGSLGLFCWLALGTDLVRDTSASRRPDGRFPFSLAKGQMAYWFFLTISAFFLLWIITGDTNSLSSSILILIGISAGTALGAAVVDASKASSAESNVDYDATESAEEISRSLKNKRTQARDKLKRALAALSTNEDSEEAQRAFKKARAELDRLDTHLKFFEWSGLQRWMYDILGDNGKISFHRFQIFVWTLVLGIVFVHRVYYELSMPEFSDTLLGLMGISAGTYIGFKIPGSAG